MPSTDVAPQFTTIIPTYRRPQLLRRAILSVLAQREVPLQVCVYDNASGDETARVVAELARSDPRVKYHCHERNFGGYYNFEYGISHVVTPYFSFLSDDDVQLPGFYESAARGFATFPSAMLWGGTTIRIDDSGTIYDAKVEHWPREGLFTPPQGLLEMVRNGAPLWTGVVFRREIIDTVGTLDEETGGASDLDLILRVAARHPFVISKQPVSLFVQHSASFGESAAFSGYWPGWAKMVRNVTSIPDLPDAVKNEVGQRLDAGGARLLLRRGASALSKRNYAFAGQAADALRTHYRKIFPAALLGMLVTICKHLSPAQALYTFAYQWTVRRMLRSRRDLQKRLAHAAAHLKGR